MSFHTKLTVTILLLIALSFGLGGMLLIYTSFDAVRSKESQAALRSFEDTRTMIWLMYRYSSGEGEESLREIMRGLDDEGYGDWMAVSVYDGDEVLYTEGPAAALAVKAEPPDGNICTLYPVNDEMGHGLVLTGNTVVEHREICLSARYDLSDAYEVYHVNSRLYLLIYAVIISVGIAVSLVLSSALTKRLRYLTSTARRISGGDLSIRSCLKKGDEFGRLSADLDRMADNLQQKINELEDRIKSQEAFTGAFAHELKTPMTSIIGFADILRQGDVDESTRTMAADYIYSESRRLERLSFKLLDLLMIKKDEPVMKKTAITPFLKDACRMLAPVLKKRNVELHVSSGGGSVLMEPDLMRSLIYNLIDNASKAIDGKGRVDVEGHVSELGAVFTVRDNGRGMEAAELAHITEAFYRTDKNRSRSQGGVGLGLALCKRIAELHGGSISFESAPGEGTTVTVEIKTGAGAGGRISTGETAVEKSGGPAGTAADAAMEEKL